MILDLGLAFLAGVLSFASTCVLPLVPAYLAWMGDRAISEGPGSRDGQLRVVGNALLFVAGFATAFTALGASAGLIGADLKLLKPVLLPAAGIALMLIGLALLLLGRIPGLMRERRLDIAHRLPQAPWASYVVGLAFAIGWTPCVGPILAAILVRASDQGTAAQGALLLASYSAGLGLPFVVAASLSGLLTQGLARVRGAYGALNAIAAIFLIAMGALIFSNRLTMLNSYLPFVNVNITTPFDSLFTATPSATAETGALKVGASAPDILVTGLDGKQLRLSSLKGRPVLVSFWATWCAPCREELPAITQAYERYRSKGFEVVAIDYGDESVSTVSSFWSSLQLAPQPYVDPDLKAADAYGVGLKSTGLPVSVLIDRQGKVAAYEPFPLTSAFINQALAKVL